MISLLTLFKMEGSYNNKIELSRNENEINEIPANSRNL